MIFQARRTRVMWLVIQVIRVSATGQVPAGGASIRYQLCLNQ